MKQLSRMPNFEFLNVVSPVKQSFLLQLLKVLKPNGAIILPVYPEGQAQEKGYWSRSFLENIFLSRQRWTGFSNVRAENDGVM